MTPAPLPGTCVFVLPLASTQYLVYAPLHHLAALVDGRAAKSLQDWLMDKSPRPGRPLAEVADALAAAPAPTPRPRQGEFVPAFLGLIPTRSCNLACGYCGFQASGAPDRVMDPALACDAVDWYVGVAAGAGRRTAEVHFFGGEPFCAPEVVDVAYHAARLAAERAGGTVRFEVATNGTFDEERCRWVADSLDCVVLSLDGPASIQDRQRPRRGGQGSYEAVVRSGRILSAGTAELCIRACITAETVGQMADIAIWLAEELRPVSVSFEPVQPSGPAARAGLEPPDPWAFAQGYARAAEALEAYGVEAVYAAADIRSLRASFCPVGQDVAIVWPDGTIAGCYLPEEEWKARGLDLVLGRMEDGRARLDAGRVAAARAMTVWHKPGCAECFCRWHCAGGCHVNHSGPTAPGDYDRLCLQTRLIATRSLLHAVDRDDVARVLFDDPARLEALAWQRADTIARVEVRS